MPDNSLPQLLLPQNGIPNAQREEEVASTEPQKGQTNFQMEDRNFKETKKWQPASSHRLPPTGYTFLGLDVETNEPVLVTNEGAQCDRSAGLPLLANL